MNAVMSLQPLRVISKAQYFIFLVDITMLAFQLNEISIIYLLGF